MTHRLDSILRSTGFGINNTGPAVAAQVKRHGRKNYDADAREVLETELQEAGDDVNRMLRNAADGGAVDGSEISSLVGSCIQGLTIDFDSALSVAMSNSDDPSLAQNSLNVAMLGMAIGVEMQLDEKNVQLIGVSGLVQDWGMAKVAPGIRDAKRPLTTLEFLEIQKHPGHTLNLLERIQNIPNIVRLVAFQSHERLDGSGYPQGRRREGIHMFAKILHVADSYIGMTSERPHRPAFMPYAAMECLLDQAKRCKLEPEVVRSLLHVLSLFPIGSYVALSDGAAANVIRSNGIDYTRPIVLRVQDNRGNPIDSEDESAVIDLSDSDIRIVQALPDPSGSSVAQSAELEAAV